MNLTLRILNGEFLIYDEDLKKYIPLQKKIDKEDLKERIVEMIKLQKEPIKAKNIIYHTLSTISGYEVKKHSKFVMQQELTDPLFIELYNFVINLEEYQRLIKSSRGLKTTENEFIVSDINGIVDIKTNDEIDLTLLASLVQPSLHYTYYGDISFNKTLKFIFFKYFGVSKCSFDYKNPIVNEILKKVTTVISKKVILFKDGKILVKIKDTYYIPEPHITVENLKKQIIVYINEKPKMVKKNTIIFDSLEALSGYRAIRSVSKYMPTSINGVRRDILIEEPLYKELCDFIEKIPEFLENKNKSIEEKRILSENMKKASILEKEQRFVEHSWIYNEHRHRNLYQDY